MTGLRGVAVEVDQLRGRFGREWWFSVLEEVSILERFRGRGLICCSLLVDGRVRMGRVQEIIFLREERPTVLGDFWV